MLAGEIDAALKERGERIDVEDAMIGAIAVNRNEAALTRNASHFERIEGVAVETYWPID